LTVNRRYGINESCFLSLQRRVSCENFHITYLKLTDLLDRSLIFFLFAVLSFTLRLTDFVPDNHTIALPLLITLRVLIVTSLVMDAACLFGIWVTLRKYKADDHNIGEELDEPAQA
jgi:hypothetical protein